MPGLIFRIDTESDQWIAEVADTNISYNLIGDTLDEQAENLNVLANTMQDGPDGELLDIMLDSTVEIPEDVEITTVIAELFEGTDAIILSGTPIFSVVLEEDTIMTELADAGTALLMFL